MKKIYLTLSLIIMMFFPSITFGNVIDKLNEVGKFSKLNETLTKSGLVENLKGNGPFTVLHH